MKKFENRATEITGLKSDGTAASYCDVIRLTLNLPPDRSGFTVGMMRDRFRILDAFDLADKNKQSFVDLEDADFELMRKTFIEFGHWTFIHKDIIAIDEYLKSFN